MAEVQEIQEISLDNPEDINEIIKDNVEIVGDNTEETKVVEESAPVLPEEASKENIKPKAKGRPKGAPNKGPSKPRAKKPQVKETPVEAAEDVAYEPSSPKRNLNIPTDPTSSDIAAAMLKLLQDQSSSRQSRKQRLYNSWFQ